MRFDLEKANVSNAVRRLNPGLFGVGALPGPQPQHHAPVPLDRKPQGPATSRKGLAPGRRGPVLRVVFITFRRSGRALDHDNLVGGLKHLRDAIAAWFGIDDADHCIAWEYSQHETRGAEGVGVKLEKVLP